MKKILAIFFTCLLTIFALTGCNGTNSESTAQTNDLAETHSIEPTEKPTEIPTEKPTEEPMEEPTEDSHTEPVEETPVPGLEEISEPTQRIVKQSDGSELAFDEIPEKVLVLSSTTLELLDAVGVEITASSSLSSRPGLAEKFKDATDVGMATNPDMEIIAQVNPDIIIAGSMFINMKEQFEAQGYKTWFVNNQTYDDTLILIESFGHLFDKQETAAYLINDFETRKQAALDASKDQETQTVMIIFGAGEQIMFGTDKCYSGSLVKLIGHNNVADNMDTTAATSGYIPFSLEAAIASNPDVILRIAHGNPEETKKMFDELFDQNHAYKESNAVKNGKVHDLSYDLFFSNPGLRCIEAIEELGSILSE